MKRRLLLRSVVASALVFLPFLASAQVDLRGYLISHDEEVVIDTTVFLFGLRIPIPEATPGWSSQAGELDSFRFPTLPRWPDRGVRLVFSYAGGAPTSDSILPLVLDQWFQVRVGSDSFQVLFSERGYGLEESGRNPAGLMLAIPGPNPFRRAAAISYTGPTAGSCELAVFDLNGTRVRTLASGPAEPGTRVLAWNGTTDAGRAVRSGVYFCRLATGNTILTRKLILDR